MPKISFKKSFRKSFKKPRPASRKRAAFRKDGDSAPPSAWIAPIRKAVLLKPHFFMRKAYTQTALGTSSPAGVNVDSYSNFTFKLSDVPGYAEFVNMFDQFCITKVKMTFMPRFSGNPVTGSGIGVGYGTAALASIWTCVDYDGNSPTSLSTFLERSDLEQHRHDKEFSMTFQPRPNNEIYRTSVTTAYSVMPRGYNWIDTKDAVTPHYGIMYYCQAPTSNGLCVAYDTTIEYWMGFRGVV